MEIDLEEKFYLIKKILDYIFSNDNRLDNLYQLGSEIGLNISGYMVSGKIKIRGCQENIFYIIDNDENSTINICFIFSDLEKNEEVINIIKKLNQNDKYEIFFDKSFLSISLSKIDLNLENLDEKVALLIIETITDPFFVNTIKPLLNKKNRKGSENIWV